MALYVVVGATVRGGVIRIPETVVMPVRLREISSDHEILLPEGVENIFSHILLGVVLEGSVSDAEVVIFRVEHAETVMVFRREYHVLHSGFREHVGPLVWIEIHWVELFREAPVPLFVVFIDRAFRAADPILVANAPGLHDSRNAVKPPVHQNAKLKVLPAVQFFQYQRIRGPLVVIRMFVLGQGARCGRQ